jgi:hypothetical protein
MEAYKNILKVEQYYKNVDVKDTSSGIKATITKTWPKQTVQLLILIN